MRFISSNAAVNDPAPATDPDPHRESMQPDTKRKVAAINSPMRPIIPRPAISYIHSRSCDPERTATILLTNSVAPWRDFC